MVTVTVANHIEDYPIWVTIICEDRENDLFCIHLTREKLADDKKKEIELCVGYKKMAECKLHEDEVTIYFTDHGLGFETDASYIPNEHLRIDVTGVSLN